LAIAKGLGEQYAGDDHLQDVIESMNKQSQYLRANDIEKATAHKAKVRALEIAKQARARKQAETTAQEA